jgi:hypothetical protein
MLRLCHCYAILFTMLKPEISKLCYATTHPLMLLSHLSDVPPHLSILLSDALPDSCGPGRIRSLVVFPCCSGALSVGHCERADWHTITDIAQGNKSIGDVDKDLVSNAGMSWASHEAIGTKGISAHSAVLRARLKVVDKRSADGSFRDEVGMGAGEEKLSAWQGVGLLTARHDGGEATRIGEHGLISWRALALSGNAARARGDGLGKIEPEFAAVGVDRFEVKWLHIGSNDQAVGRRESSRCVWILS